MKIVINTSYGPFALSQEAILEVAKRKGIPIFTQYLEGDQFHRELLNWVIPESEVPEQPEWLTDAYFDYHQFIKHNTFWVGQDDPMLVEVVEEFGERAAKDQYTRLKVVEIPDDVDWEIKEYDGAQWIAEKHRTWR